MSEEVDKALVFLRDRKVAYGITFAADGQAAKAVLEDLAKFCRADETTFEIDARHHALLEGRREVWLRIQEHLKLSPEELLAKYGRKTR